MLLETCPHLFTSSPLHKPTAPTWYTTRGCLKYWIHNVRCSTALHCYLYQPFEFQRKLYSLVRVVIHRQHLKAAQTPSNRRGNWQIGGNDFEWDRDKWIRERTLWALQITYLFVISSFGLSSEKVMPEKKETWWKSQLISFFHVIMLCPKLTVPTFLFLKILYILIYILPQLEMTLSTVISEVFSLYNLYPNQ